MKELFCKENHRVYPELNKIMDYYGYFCPRCDENYYTIELTEKEVDNEIKYKILSSNGELYLNKDGDVIYQLTSPDCYKVIWFDLEEYKEFWGKEPQEEIDILDIRGILANGRELIWNSSRSLQR